MARLYDGLVLLTSQVSALSFGQDGVVILSGSIPNIPFFFMGSAQVFHYWYGTLPPAGFAGIILG